MTGHNHRASCTCGWCLNVRHGGHGQPIYLSTARTPSFSGYASFTNPNAICPVCGASVFFYQSPAGGRVFFDELGPPWPKHGCTDDATKTVRRLTNERRTPAVRPAWQKDGWDPIEMRSSRMEGSWHSIPVVSETARFYVLAEATFRVPGELCAFMKPWDLNGWSVISYVDLDGTADEKLILIFNHKRFARTSSFSAASKRKAARGSVN